MYEGKMKKTLSTTCMKTKTETLSTICTIVVWRQKTCLATSVTRHTGMTLGEIECICSVVCLWNLPLEICLIGDISGQHTLGMAPFWENLSCSLEIFGDQTGEIWLKQDSGWLMQPCVNDVVCMLYTQECTNVWMYKCMNESKTSYDGVTVWLYITWWNKTRQVRWEVDRHRSTNTRQSSSEMMPLEKDQTTNGVKPVNQTTDSGRSRHL